MQSLHIIENKIVFFLNQIKLIFSLISNHINDFILFYAFIYLILSLILLTRGVVLYRKFEYYIFFTLFCLFILAYLLSCYYITPYLLIFAIFPIFFIKNFSVFALFLFIKSTILSSPFIYISIVIALFLTITYIHPYTQGALFLMDILAFGAIMSLFLILFMHIIYTFGPILLSLTIAFFGANLFLFSLDTIYRLFNGEIIIPFIDYFDIYKILIFDPIANIGNVEYNFFDEVKKSLTNTLYVHMASIIITIISFIYQKKKAFMLLNNTIENKFGLKYPTWGGGRFLFDIGLIFESIEQIKEDEDNFIFKKSRNENF